MSIVFLKKIRSFSILLETLRLFITFAALVRVVAIARLDTNLALKTVSQPACSCPPLRHAPSIHHGLRVCRAPQRKLRSAVPPNFLVGLSLRFPFLTITLYHKGYKKSRVLGKIVEKILHKFQTKNCATCTKCQKPLVAPVHERSKKLCAICTKKERGVTPLL